jgi:hypothetical protein
MFGKRAFTGLVLILINAFCITSLFAQQADTLKGKNLYNPQRLGSKDTIPAGIRIAEPIPSTDGSFGLHEKFVVDSILIREQFVRDSVLVREQFVKDSILHRQRILDSLTFLQKELPGLLNAWFRTVKEEFILRAGKITIIGDSVLSDYEYLMLPFSITQPYTPWRARLSLTDNAFKLNIDKKIQKITSIQAPFMRCSFTYGNHDNILVINERSIVQSHYSDKFYKTPFDSIFFDRYKRVVKIKRYNQFYGVINNNQQGAPLFLYLSQVMQYEYGPDNQLTQYQVTKFCERWKVYEPGKVCSIITYAFSKKDNTYLLTRRNDPANGYSDGTFTFEFDGSDNLKSVSFHNLSNTENWQRSVELNKDGNVSCYIDKTNEIIRQSLCMIYHDKDPGAKYPVETVTTTFEKNGISYYQKNNTTGLIRVRDKMTLEWSPWR